MRCREFEDRLNDVLDQRLSPERDASLLRHAGECGSCRQVLDGQAALFTGLRRLNTPALSSRFAADVLVRAGATAVERAPREERSKTIKWLAVVVGLVSIAAVLLVGVWIGLSGRNPAGPTVVKKDANPAPKNIEVAKNSLPSKVSRPPAVANIVKPPSIEPQKTVRDYEQYREAINSLAAQLPSAVERIDEVQQSTPAIRPLRASFSMAIGTLQKTIPNRGLKREPRPVRPDSGSYGQTLEVVV